MELFRISKCRYIRDINGTGARMYGGRWNSKGFPVLYTAGSMALAALETLVHIPQKNMTKDFCSLTLHLPESIRISHLKEQDLPDGWKSVPILTELQELGDLWLKEAKFAVLRVPSVLIPEEYNYLINPLHPDSKMIKMNDVSLFVFDERLAGNG